MFGLKKCGDWYYEYHYMIIFKLLRRLKQGTCIYLTASFSKMHTRVFPILLRNPLGLQVLRLVFSLPLTIRIAQSDVTVRCLKRIVHCRQDRSRTCMNFHSREGFPSVYPFRHLTMDGSFPVGQP